MKRLVPIVFGGVVLAGLLVSQVRVSWRGQASEAQATSGLGIGPGAPQASLAPTEVYARAAQAAYKSVVNIDLTERVRVRSFWFDEDVFGPRYQEQQSHGSGVIVTKDGYILTNEHVIVLRDTTDRRITVTMTDGRKLTGTVVGADKLTDVGLVKVDAKDLPAAALGTVRGLVPGQMVVAIGNPLDLRFTVSNGVVSALGRPINVDKRVYSDLIQHDALINPGNSGGPLVNLSGAVVGINTLVRPDAQGIGFAIPIDTALKVADELKRFGKIKRPWLGLVVASNNSSLVARYGLPDVAGAVVLSINGGGPASDAGFEPGDVIVRIADKPVKGEDDFRKVERELRIRERVNVEVRRGDQKGRATVTVGEAP